MQGETYSVRAVIKIQTPPEYVPRTGQFRSGALYGFDSANQTGPGAELESIFMSKSKSQCAGRFTLTFAPKRVQLPKDPNWYYWSDVIPSYSLVEIYLQRYPRDAEPVLRMVGLTGPRGRTENYGQPPSQSVQIAGQELSGIFTEQKILFLPQPPESMQADVADIILPNATDDNGNPLSASPIMVGTPTGTNASHAPPTTLPATATQQLALFGMLAIEPTLAWAGDSPIQVVDRFIKMLTVGQVSTYNPTAMPLLNLQFPDSDTTLVNLVRFDPAKATLFDPNAKLPASAQLTFDSTLWNLMTGWSDPAYQEMFWVSRDLSKLPDPSNGNKPLSETTKSPVAIELIFRKKPFAGWIDERGELQGVAPAQGTQFDGEFLNDPANTVRITGNDVEHEAVAQSADNVSNIYFVIPQLLWANHDKSFESMSVPLGDNDGTSPSRLSRYGPRLMRVPDYYIRLPDTEQEQKEYGDPFSQARERQRLLRAWHRFEPLFYAGSLRLKGNSQVQVGKRLVDQRSDGDREYYIEGWSDAVDMKQGTWAQTVQVERGWDLAH